MLKEPPWSRDEDIHARQSFPLVLEVLPSNNEARREAMISTNTAQDFENLGSLQGVGNKQACARTVYSPVLL